MLTTLRILLVALGISAIAICLSVMFAGPEATAGVSERLYDALSGWGGPSSGPWPPTMDSELRFYAPFWGTYGLALIWVARNLPQRLSMVPWLALLFFTGGVGRAISYASVGAPHPVFVSLMAIELLTPPILVALWWATRRPA